MGYLYFALAIIAAGFFFWPRSNHRILYGLSEVVVGLSIIALRFLVTQPTFIILDGPDPIWFSRLTAMISLFAGIYAIVRGLENIVTTLRNPHEI
jgi:hypothetical protein